jgi:hypothetical protein
MISEVEYLRVTAERAMLSGAPYFTAIRTTGWDR